MNSLRNELRESYNLNTSDILKGGIHRNILGEQLVNFGFDDYEHDLDLKGQLSLKIFREEGYIESIIIGFDQNTHKITLVYIRAYNGKNVSMIEVEEGEIYSLNEVIKKILFIKY